MDKKILRIENLSILLKGSRDIIIDDISFDVSEGDCLALSGKNGCGKSTILRAIHGNTSDYVIKGKIMFEGQNILDLNEHEISDYRSQIGYVPQKDDYEGFKVTISDLIMDSASVHQSENRITRKIISQYFDELGLRQFDAKGKVLFDENTICNGKLSGGQQRLVSILITLLARPNAKLYIIDEPLNNLDFSIACKISNLITRISKSKDCAILMVTHCRIFTAINREIVLEKGKITKNLEGYSCHACFGEPNANGYYE